ncbi:MAG: peroxidase-related enzyme [Armatimonas sp.]
MKQAPMSPLADLIVFEKATLFVVGKADDTQVKELLAGLAKFLKDNPNAVVKMLTPAEAAKAKLTEVPIAIVVDRRGREQGRGITPDAVLPALKKAVQIGRIDWAMEGEPSGDAVKKLMPTLPSVDVLPGIMRAMSLNPEAMMGMIQMAQRMHFRDGVLPVRVHELIATYVSSLNQCQFCLTSHAGFLGARGQDKKDVDAVALGDPSKAPGLKPAERALLSYIKRLTLEPAKINDLDIEALRKVGWKDAEIYEATFVGSLFAFYNRMANAYGLDMAPDGWRPPTTATSKS